MASNQEDMASNQEPTEPNRQPRDRKAAETEAARLKENGEAASCGPCGRGAAFEAEKAG